MSARKKAHPLQKTQSWAAPTAADRARAWEQKRELMLRRSKSTSNIVTHASITDHDVEELKACFDLGFGFDSSKPDQKLVETFPALQLYYDVASCLPRSSSDSSTASDSEPSKFSLLVTPGVDPKTAKMRLKQWAQLVGCSIRGSLPTN